MNYQEILDFLYNQFPQYQKIGGDAYKPGLNNIKTICKYLGNPQDHLKVIHIAGTNGKGSTCSTVASILQEAGYKVGLFTSPHLIDFSERIRINGTPINQNSVVKFVQDNKAYFSSLNISFFEWTTALAFYHFKQSNVDYAVIEVGLGGRLDSTNIVNPLVCGITKIGLDHQEYLGNDISSIAKEKAGIIKNDVPCFVQGVNDPSALDTIAKVASSKNAELTVSQSLKAESDLKGGFQCHNFGLAKDITSYLNVDNSYIEKGIRNVLKNTKHRGRWELLQQNPEVIADIGHNLDAVQEIVSELSKREYENLHIVWGMVQGKDIEAICEILPKDAKYYLCSPNIRRALAIDELANYFSAHESTAFSSVKNAFKKARDTAIKEDLVLVGGSNFVVSEVIDDFFN